MSFRRYVIIARALPRSPFRKYTYTSVFDPPIIMPTVTRVPCECLSPLASRCCFRRRAIKWQGKDRKSSFEEENTYRPRKFEGKPNGIDEPIRLLVGQVHRVVAEHWGDHVAEGAPRVGIDGRLVVLETDTKPRLARSYAFARLRV